VIPESIWGAYDVMNSSISVQDLILPANRRDRSDGGKGVLRDYFKKELPKLLIQMLSFREKGMSIQLSLLNPYRAANRGF